MNADLRWLAARFYAPGYDREDLEQEARIAAWLNPGFEYNAARCRLIDIVRHETRGRAAGSVPTLCELQDVPGGDLTVEAVLARERVSAVRRVMREELSDREREAVRHVVNGGAYYGNKALDSAMHRARRKLRAA